MPTFLWKAKNADDREIVERIEAETASESRKELESRGLTDLRLVKEEGMDAASAGVVEATRPEFHVDLSPEQEMAFIERREPGFWARWGMSIMKSLPWVAITGVLLWNVFPSNRLWVFLICLGEILLFPLLNYWYGRPTRLYDDLTRARTWSRWREVLRLADKLSRASSVVGIGVPQWELARHRGMALAGLGRLDEGIEVFREAAEESELEDWLTYAHLAEISTQAGRHAESLALKQKSAEEQPANMNPLIDLAMHHVHYMADASSAREVMARIDRHIVVEFAEPYLDLIDGMILCEDGRFSRALEPLESALAAFGKHRHQPAFEGIILLTESYLCLAYASMRRTDEARSLWPIVEKYLTAGKEKRLLERIRAVI